MDDSSYKFIEDPNDRPVMDCGHLALYQRSFNEDGKIVEVPVCVQCSCYVVEKSNINLSKRIARCNMCGKEVKSDFNLLGFHYLKKKDHDTFYCGCANETFLELMTIAQSH